MGTALNRAKLANVLARLGSNHAGERDAAGLAADRMVRAAGLSWGDVLTEAEASRRREVPRPPAPAWAPAPTDHWQDLRTCAAHEAALTGWERQYVASLWHAQRVSPKQRRILADIAERLRRTGSRAG